MHDESSRMNISNPPKAFSNALLNKSLFGSTLHVFVASTMVCSAKLITRSSQLVNGFMHQLFHIFVFIRPGSQTVFHTRGLSQLNQPWPWGAHIITRRLPIPRTSSAGCLLFECFNHVPAAGYPHRSCINLPSLSFGSGLSWDDLDFGLVLPAVNNVCAYNA